MSDKSPASTSLEQAQNSSSFVSTQEGDKTTRSQIFHLLLHEGSLTAVEIAKRLDLAPEGIRRHLQEMTEDGFVQIVSIKTYPQAGAHHRGRPAKFYELTSQGRKQSGYFDSQLTIDALQTIQDIAGESALHNFSRARMDRIFAQTRESLPIDAGLMERAFALGNCLSEHGFAASVKKMRSGVEICQRNCPYDTIAEQFPIFCQSEHEVFSEFFDRPIQRLATIAGGQKVCTTFIPMQNHSADRSN